MRLCFFNNKRLGLVKGEQVFDVTEALESLTPLSYPFPRHDLFVAALPEIKDKIVSLAESATAIELSEVTLLSPVQNPGKIVAAPVNYQAHIQEAVEDEETFSRHLLQAIEKSGLFLKAPSSLIGAGQEIDVHFPDRRTDHEVELAVIIGEPCKAATHDNALSFVAGYSIGLDITIRGPEERSFRKSIDTYTVLGPWMVTADEIGDPSGMEMKLSVNEEARQHANTKDLIMNVKDLIVFASSFYTLEPGDILLTGTPEGVGPILRGDTIHASIDKIGAMDVVCAK
jgi:2-keto-4-pentenoate hydratase/2-oxohepta-3-ene-1,7-dioic acid hydratase in catechol pathway